MTKVPRKSFWKQTVVLMPVYMTQFMMGCASGWLSNAVYFLLQGKKEEMHATSSQCVLIASLSLVSKIPFAIPAGILTDKYGRRKMIIGVAVLLVFSWSAISLNNHLFTIYLSRFVGGIAEIMISTTSTITIGEISSPEIRGQLTNIGLVVMSIGIIAPSIISIIFQSYKALTWSVTIFSIVSLLPAFWATETPSFLVSVSKIDQAKDILKRIRPGHPQNEIDGELEKMMIYIEEEKTRRSEISWLKFIKSKSVRRPLMIGILITIFSCLMGIIVVKVYAAVIIPPNDFVPNNYYPLIIQIVSFIISISTTFYIDRFPRRTIYLVGTLAMIIINVISAFASYFIAQNQYKDISKWIFTAGNILLLVCYCAGMQPLNTTLSSELYPQAVKGFCGSVISVIEAVSLISIYYLYSFITEHFHLYFMYVIFSTNAVLLFLVVYFFLPESRGVFLTDLQMKFKENPLLPRRT